MYLQMNINTLIVLFSVLFLISYTSYKIYQKFYSGQHKNTNALYAKNSLMSQNRIVISVKKF